MELTLNHISKSYGKTKALQDFTVNMTPGIYALLGPNGSGKSTLMNIITDNLKADEGGILFDGQNVAEMGTRFREKLGYMPQYPGMYESFTAWQYLDYMAGLKNVGQHLKGRARKAYIQDQIQEILTAVDLTEFRDRRIGAFSGGMKQRLALAQAVLGDSSVLILDEPTAGLDPKQRIEIRNFISRISLDKIVLIATHVVSDVEYIAKTALILKNGRLIDCAPPHELSQKINGKVWQVACRPDEVATLSKTLRVVGISKEDGNDDVVLRVISETCPVQGAWEVEATLEDYYLYTFSVGGLNEKTF